MIRQQSPLQQGCVAYSLIEPRPCDYNEPKSNCPDPFRPQTECGHAAESLP
jgi:hypothetical protein